MDKLTVQVIVTVVEYVAFDNADIDREDELCREAEDQIRADIEAADMTVQDTDCRVRWEHD